MTFLPGYRSLDECDAFLPETRWPALRATAGGAVVSRTVPQRKPRRVTVPVARSAWAELKHGWGGAYDFQRHDLGVRAVRRDGLGWITANSPEQLGPLVAADYAERPVPRTVAA
jgi:hypothetical protein